LLWKKNIIPNKKEKPNKLKRQPNGAGVIVAAAAVLLLHRTSAREEGE